VLRADIGRRGEGGLEHNLMSEAATRRMLMVRI
jgi:hypothetical protein